jgi:hypothetical protein
LELGFLVRLHDAVWFDALSEKSPSRTA